MNIHITHVSTRFVFAFTYNIPQGCAAHLRIPYLTEQAPHVSWKSHHIRHSIFISWTWTTRPIILAGFTLSCPAGTLPYSHIPLMIRQLAPFVNLPTRHGAVPLSFCASLFPLSTHNITSVVFGKYRIHAELVVGCINLFISFNGR